jgi:histidinol-phosphate phosphatase family protein
VVIFPSRPTQAVILCGGLGTRLKPFTDNVPKPMVLVNDKPFLYYLLQQLSEQGISHFILLTGYRSDQILNYFQDGSLWNWSIEYSHGPAEWDTGRRLWEARKYYDSDFLLLYADNFVQFKLNKLIDLHETKKKPISLLLAEKKNGNIRLLEDGTINAYDKNRNGEGFDYVEVGYMLIRRDQVLERFKSQVGFPDFNFSLILKELAENSLIAGVPVLDPYHSISDPTRLKLMTDYLSYKKILLIDRDGTVNTKAPKGKYISNINEFKWIIETRQAMKKLAEEGFKFIVITNQAGIARGMIDSIELEKIHKTMIGNLASEGIEVLEVYCCPDHWDSKSLMRKPAPGMFFKVAKDYKLRMDRCFYVGDDERDIHAAYNAGCGMIFLSEKELDISKDNYPEPYLSVRSLLEAVEFIKEIHKVWEQSA